MSLTFSDLVLGGVEADDDMFLEEIEWVGDDLFRLESFDPRRHNTALLDALVLARPKKLRNMMGMQKAIVWRKRNCKIVKERIIREALRRSNLEEGVKS